LELADINTFTCLYSHDPYYKVFLIRKVEKLFNIEFLGVGFIADTDVKILFVKKLFQSIKQSFGTKKELPVDMKQLKELYIMMLKSVTSIKFIDRNLKRDAIDNTKRYYEYSLNIDVIKYHNELLNFKTQDKKEFCKDATNFLKFNRNLLTDYYEATLAN
jgi:hypothetical protein